MRFKNTAAPDSSMTERINNMHTIDSMIVDVNTPTNIEGQYEDIVEKKVETASRTLIFTTKFIPSKRSKALLNDEMKERVLEEIEAAMSSLFDVLNDRGEEIPEVSFLPLNADASFSDKVVTYSRPVSLLEDQTPHTETVPISQILPESKFIHIGQMPLVYAHSADESKVIFSTKLADRITEYFNTMNTGVDLNVKREPTVVSVVDVYNQVHMAWKLSYSIKGEKFYRFIICSPQTPMRITLHQSAAKYVVRPDDMASVVSKSLDEDIRIWLASFWRSYSTLIDPNSFKSDFMGFIYTYTNISDDLKTEIRRNIAESEDDDGEVEFLSKAGEGGAKLNDDVPRDTQSTLDTLQTASADDTQDETPTNDNTEDDGGDDE